MPASSSMTCSNLEIFLLAALLNLLSSQAVRPRFYYDEFFSRELATLAKCVPLPSADTPFLPERSSNALLLAVFQHMYELSKALSGRGSATRLSQLW